jgi:hypothetical protein
MRIRGALHLHSTFSYDGKLPLEDIAALYRERGFQFVAFTEHSQDMNVAKVGAFCRMARELSSEQFLMIPGIEYSCAGMVHIAGIGCVRLFDSSDAAEVASCIRTAGGFAVLAHPRRIAWNCSAELLNCVNAAELWNVRYDGKFLPSPAALEFFNQGRALNPKLLAAVGDDFHSFGGFYPLAVVLDVDALSREAIVRRLIHGEYEIRCPFFRASAQEPVGPAMLARVRTMRAILDPVKRVRQSMTQGRFR